MQELERISASFAAAVWSSPLVALLLGGGLFFAAYSRLLPYRHLGHAVVLVLGRHRTPAAPGELSHGQALAIGCSVALEVGGVVFGGLQRVAKVAVSPSRPWSFSTWQ